MISKIFFQTRNWNVKLFDENSILITQLVSEFKRKWGIDYKWISTRAIIFGDEFSFQGNANEGGLLFLSNNIPIGKARLFHPSYSYYLLELDQKKFYLMSLGLGKGYKIQDESRKVVMTLDGPLPHRKNPNSPRWIFFYSGTNYSIEVFNSSLSSQTLIQLALIAGYYLRVWSEN